MTSRNSRTVVMGIAANFAVAGVLAVGAAIASAAAAGADPDAPLPPTDPVAPPPSGLNDFLAGPLTSLLGSPAQTGSGAPTDFVLSQYPVPAVPGAAPPGMDLNTALSGSTYLLPQNFELATPDEGNMYTIGQGEVLDQPSLIPALKGGHALWHAGLGRLDQQQLGQPLPGTAPPPGTNLPAGPEQFLPDPPAPPDISPPPLLPGG